MGSCNLVHLRERRAIELRCKICGKEDRLENFLVCYTGKDGDFNCQHLDELNLDDVVKVRDIEHEDCLKEWQATIDELRTCKQEVSMTEPEPPRKLTHAELVEKYGFTKEEAEELPEGILARLTPEHTEMLREELRNGKPKNPAPARKRVM